MSFGPYDAATDAIQRARRLLAASDQAPFGDRGDMRRLGVVMAVAALDTYMHRLIVDRAFARKEMPRELARLSIDFGDLLAEADKGREAARKKPHSSRPRVAVKRQLRDRLLRETFQRYDSVSRALKMAGGGGDWVAIGQHLKPTMTPDQIKARLDGIVTRRNQIVHEGDYRRLERPQSPGRNEMRPEKASSDVAFLAQLIDAIHTVH